ncbi:MAG: hypothetical protein IPH33_00050 [Bacteroidetes bacterium]|nr:hypothetical protein [Bacteroidota bacterium]
MKIKLLFVLILFNSSSLLSNSNQSIEDSLQSAFLSAKIDSVQKNRLDDLANFYYSDSPKGPQECFDQLKKVIEQKKDAKLEYMLLLYRVVLLHTQDSIIETRKYLNQFLEQCLKYDDKKQYANGLIMLSNSSRYAGNYNEALKLMLLALDYARDTLKDKKMIGEVYLTLAVFHYEQQDTLKAIEFNKMALKEMTDLNHLSNMASVCNNLAMQYSALAKYDSAEFYFRESIRLFHLQFEEPNLRNPLMNLAEVFRLTHQYDSAILYTRNAIHNAIKIKDTEIIGFAYWQIAKIFKDIGKSDSALKYFELANEEIERNVPENARIYFYPELAGFFASIGNHKEAYFYLKKAISIKETVFNAENNKVLKEMDIKYQTSQKEKELLKQEEQIKRQRILTYSMIAIAAFFLLLVFFIYRSYRLKRKANELITYEKKRSDDLLLNILPSEVAEELKEKGSAEAKHFDQVTVLFTDFKNFTQISEKLSPSELVAEIHTCFKAFDTIITKHNIEKIKTIGDAYMCAGGLPIANKTHAIDVVYAALEIQQFIQEHLEQRKKENKEPFEIRIGIHTGPVVAGIVGVKKFAYDIWGDTVNIASRMESSGEAGKVNISGSTYELVKNKFNCIFRGKIPAKNKGEIDMYFANNKV